MRNRLVLFLPIFLLVLTYVAFGESSSNPLSAVLKTPEITYDRFEVRHIGTDKADVDFIFVVNNPNPIGLDTILMDYELFLKDQSALTGRDIKFAAKASAKSELRLPAQIDYLKAFKSADVLAQAIMGGQKTVPFTLNTVFRVSVMSASFKIPVTAKGDLPLPELSVNSF